MEPHLVKLIKPGESLTASTHKRFGHHHPGGGLEWCG